MAFTLGAKKIHCPNCHYEGKAKVLGSGCGLWLVWLVSVACAIAFFWLIVPPIICVLLFFWLLLKSARQVCKVCGNQNVVPLAHWRKMNPSKG
jgi:hypothetical protein